MKPRILVTSAVGHTGSIVVKQLLAKGFRVRALVRRQDFRSEQLKQLGAEIFVGDLLDLRDLRQALIDVQRAYYCFPFAPNLLHGAMLFALAAEEAKLEVMVALTAWNPHPTHPSIHQREHWLANNIHHMDADSRCYSYQSGYVCLHLFLWDTPGRSLWAVDAAFWQWVKCTTVQ